MDLARQEDMRAWLNEDVAAEQGPHYERARSRSHTRHMMRARRRPHEDIVEDDPYVIWSAVWPRSIPGTQEERILRPLYDTAGVDVGQLRAAPTVSEILTQFAASSSQWRWPLSKLLSGGMRRGCVWRHCWIFVKDHGNATSA